MNVCAKHALMPVIVICVECIWLQTGRDKGETRKGPKPKGHDVMRLGEDSVWYLYYFEIFRKITENCSNSKYILYIYYRDIKITCRCKGFLP